MAVAPIKKPPVPSLIPLQPLVPGKWVKIRGKTTKNAETFVVNLKTQKYVAMSISFQIESAGEGLSNVTLNSNTEKGAGQPQVETPVPLAKDSKFVLQIICDIDDYKIFFNAEAYCTFDHRIPFAEVTFLHIDGHIVINSIEFSRMRTQKEVLKLIRIDDANTPLARTSSVRFAPVPVAQAAQQQGTQGGQQGMQQGMQPGMHHPPPYPPPPAAPAPAQGGGIASTFGKAAVGGLGAGAGFGLASGVVQGIMGGGGGGGSRGRGEGASDYGGHRERRDDSDGDKKEDKNKSAEENKDPTTAPADANAGNTAVQASADDTAGAQDSTAAQPTNATADEEETQLTVVADDEAYAAEDEAEDLEPEPNEEPESEPESYEEPEPEPEPEPEYGDDDD